MTCSRQHFGADEGVRTVKHPSSALGRKNRLTEGDNRLEAKKRRRSNLGQSWTYMSRYHSVARVCRDMTAITVEQQQNSNCSVKAKNRVNKREEVDKTPRWARSLFGLQIPLLAGYKSRKLKCIHSINGSQQGSRPPF